MKKQKINGMWNIGEDVLFFIGINEKKFQEFKIKNKEMFEEKYGIVY